jgi:hypothetical protein
MDPRIKALTVAALSIPFGLILVEFMQAYGMFPIFGTDGWNDMKLVVGSIFGLTYVVALSIFRR